MSDKKEEEKQVSDEKIMSVEMSEYKSTMLADMGLQNLLSMHTDAKYGKAEEIVNDLKEGKTVTVQLPKEGSTPFFRGLKNYKLKFTEPENEN